MKPLFIVYLCLLKCFLLSIYIYKKNKELRFFFSHKALIFFVWEQ